MDALDILLAVLPWVGVILVVLIIFCSCIKIVPKSRA